MDIEKGKTNQNSKLLVPNCKSVNLSLKFSVISRYLYILILTSSHNGELNECKLYQSKCW